LKNRVIDSIETPDGGRCVDIFLRPDGNYGFEIYRRDVELLTGWFPIGSNIDTTFLTEHSARQAAYDAAPWIDSKKPNQLF
jgi:hypothetical protein